MTTISQAYREAHPDIRAQFNKPPEALLSEVPGEHAWPPALAQSLTVYQQELGVEKKPLTGSEPVIVTGQQPGLFTGPLYTVLKAITALQAAEALRQQGVPCVPLFWVAGEDHDFEEVRTAHFLDRQYEVLSLSYTPETPRAYPDDIPMNRMPLSPRVHTLIDTAADACRNSERAASVTAFLHDSLDRAHSLSHWFSLVMARLFSDTDLILFEPSMTAARAASIPVLRREIENPLHSTRLLIEEGEKLASLGFRIPIQRDAHTCNFFLEVGGRRRNVLFQQGKYGVRGNNLLYSVKELIALLDTEPERFSPNVALRPMVQQSLFAPVAYVAGPGEIDYWAQLKPLFNFFELPMPIVYPRLRAMITTIKLNKLLERYQITAADVMGESDLLTRLLRKTPDPELSGTFAAEKTHVEEAVDRLVSALNAVSGLPATQKATAAFRRHTHFRLEKLERALLYADKTHRGQTESHLQRLSNTLYPFGMPQERVLSVFSFLFEHGWPLISRMLTEFDFNNRDVQELEL